MISKPDILGQSEIVNFPELKLINVPARIDTGARTSTIWASSVKENNGGIDVILFGSNSEYYTGNIISFTEHETRIVTPSNGISDERYMVKLLVKIGGRKIRARFTLADRSKQTYPILIGRNVLRGKFIVDIKHNHIIVKNRPKTHLKLKES
jgi:hypothetical protein